MTAELCARCDHARHSHSLRGMRHCCARVETDPGPRAEVAGEPGWTDCPCAAYQPAEDVSS